MRIRLSIRLKFNTGEINQPPNKGTNSIPELLAIALVRNKKSTIYTALKISASLERKDTLLIIKVNNLIVICKVNH